MVICWYVIDIIYICIYSEFYNRKTNGRLWDYKKELQPMIKSLRSPPGLAETGELTSG